jgi:HrpA-like RNA helicase
MEYYCKRFKFSKPDITFQQVTTGQRHRGGGANSRWEAVMTVGGRNIGMGSGQNKKEAQTRTYLDVASYLESCDHDLWTHFLSNTDTRDIGLAPHLQFTMSDRLHDYVYTTSEKARDSDLYAHKPQSASTAAVVVEEAGAIMPSAGALHHKSAQMKATLESYEREARHKAMRELRETLPIAAYRQQICDTIHENEVTILVAATGSGKSTQTPSYVLDHYIKQELGSAVNIFVTQPRRLAATSVSARIAEERGQNLGQEVGYQVRFDSRLPKPHGSITFVTVGIFLKRLQSALGAKGPSWFDQVSHIMVDEGESGLETSDAVGLP